MKEKPLGRPFKEKLDFFSHDVNMSNDDALSYLMKKYRNVIPYALYNIILETIYGSSEGYFMKLSERSKVLISDRVFLSINETLNLINESLNEDLFNKTLYEKYEILTSEAIQKRYIRMTDRRKRLIFINEYLLVDPLKFISTGSDLNKPGGIQIITLEQINNNEHNVTFNTINPSLNTINDNSNTQRERKEKEKEKNIISLSLDEIFKIENFSKIPAEYSKFLATNEYDKDLEIENIKKRLGASASDPEFYNVLIECLHIIKKFEPTPMPVPRIPATFNEAVERLTGKNFLENVCACRQYDLENYKQFTLDWLEKRKLSNDYHWSTSHMAKLIMDDYAAFIEKQQKKLSHAKGSFSKNRSGKGDTGFAGKEF
jgi:hypothetical protein